MKQVCIHAYGGPDQLHLEDAPSPRPEAREIVARVRAAGVNPVDWKIREGRFRARGLSLPLAMGQDFAGQIIAIGSEVSAFAVGDRVFGFANGAYAECVKAAENEIVRTPAALSDEEAAGLPTPGVTAYQVVHQAARLQSGQAVLIHGGAGAVGSIAVQLARNLGAHVSATASNREDAEYLRELGVDLAIDNSRERFEDRVHNLDAVIDLVGGDVQLRSYALIRPGGVLVTTVGSLDENQARMREIRGVRFVMGRSGADLANLAKLMERGKLRTRTARVLPLEQARQAQELSEHGGAHGKVILRVAA